MVTKFARVLSKYVVFFWEAFLSHDVTGPSRSELRKFCHDIQQLEVVLLDRYSQEARLFELELS